MTYYVTQERQTSNDKRNITWCNIKGKGTKKFWFFPKKSFHLGFTIDTVYSWKVCMSRSAAVIGGIPGFREKNNVLDCECNAMCNICTTSIQDHASCLLQMIRVLTDNFIGEMEFKFHDITFLNNNDLQSGNCSFFHVYNLN